MGIEIVSAVAALLAVGYTAYLATQLNSLKRRYTAALGNSDDTESLVHLLTSNHGRMREVNHRLDILDEEYKRLSATNSLASQKIAIIRFNPFGDTGGDQSFSLAVLDAYDSGYVLTSIHGRQGTRVYVKPIDFGKSKYALSAEEKQALQQAAKRVPATANTERD